MKKHNYVSFVRSFEMFAQKELIKSKNFFEISTFAISINQKINELVKRANDEKINEIYYLEGTLINTGMSYIRKFVLKNKAGTTTTTKVHFTNALLSNLPDKFN